MAFGWRSASGVDKENGKGKEQWDFTSMIHENTEMLQHLMFLPSGSQLITNCSVKTSVQGFNTQFKFSKWKNELTLFSLMASTLYTA